MDLKEFRTQNYSEEEKIVRIPNEEVKSEFSKILNGNDASAKWVLILKEKDIVRLVKNI